MLLARPLAALATASPDASPGGRRSRLFPQGTTLVHADLHNHTLLSDGAGDPERAFLSMRAAGLDIAALTDHATVGEGLQGSPCQGNADCQAVVGLDESSWQRTGALADAADSPGEFVAMRGFEWSSPTLGHVNVWLSSDWTDPLHTGGATTGEGAGQFIHDEFRYEDHAFPEELATWWHELMDLAPTTGTSMRLFYEWLKRHPSTPLAGGGADGLFGFNHPGREVGRFGHFAFDAALRERLVSLEIFNRDDDYLFEGTDSGVPSPLPQCLDAGWRPGLIGVTDEHGTDWGFPLGKGRAGLWVGDLSRAGVREALLARRMYATRERGLRLDAAATSAGATVRMGQALSHTARTVEFALEVDRPGVWDHHPLLVQVLRPGRPLPTIADTFPITSGEVHRFAVDLSLHDGPWAVLRVTDPGEAPDGRATGDYVSAGRAVAYASPFYLEP